MKKIFLLFAGIIMMFSSVVLVPTANASGTKFKDVQADFWAVNEINYLTEKGIIFGYPNGEFGINDKITRLQAVSMILREKGITDYSNVVNPEFVDVQVGDSGYEIIAKVVGLGIIKGKVDSNGQKIFDPSGKLTRAEMASILMKAYDLQGSTDTEYTDVPKSHWAYDAVQALTKNKITTGYGNGKFGTNDWITRTQFAVMMARMLDTSFATEQTETNTTKPPTNTTTPAKPTGKTYPDGWTAPVLKSSWSPDPATNYATLKNELGFTDDGRKYTIDKANTAIAVVAEGPTSPYEVNIVFYMWDGNAGGALKQAYRVPIVAKEVFKLYFGKDADKVWNYFNKNDIPDEFTANGRKVYTYADKNTGGVVLRVGRK